MQYMMTVLTGCLGTLACPPDPLDQPPADPRLRPVLASALMAAGHLDSSVSGLSSISPGEFADAVRFWSVEQIAYSQILKGAISSAVREYEAVAASGHSAFQDIGIAGLIEIQLANGGIDAAMRTYQEALQRVEPGMMSARRIAAGLQNAGRLQEYPPWTEHSFESPPIIRGKCDPIPGTCDAIPTIRDVWDLPEWNDWFPRMPPQ